MTNTLGIKSLALVSAVFFGAVAASQAAIIVSETDVSYNSTTMAYTATPPTGTAYVQTATVGQAYGLTGNNRIGIGGGSVAETVQIGALPQTFSSIGIVGFSPADAQQFTLTVAPVANTNASTLTIGTPVATYTFNGPKNANSTYKYFAQGYLELDLSGADLLTLPGVTGSAGYAFIYSEAGGGNAAIQDTGFGNDTYAGGRAYSGTGALFGGNEDFALTLVAAAPEPASLGTIGLAALGLLKRRSRSITI